MTETHTRELDIEALAQKANKAVLNSLPELNTFQTLQDELSVEFLDGYNTAENSNLENNFWEGLYGRVQNELAQEEVILKYIQEFEAENGITVQLSLKNTETPERSETPLVVKQYSAEINQIIEGGKQRIKPVFNDSTIETASFVLKDSKRYKELEKLFWKKLSEELQKGEGTHEAVKAVQAYFQRDEELKVTFE